MNRRTFFSSVIMLPFVVATLKATPAIQTDKFVIMDNREIVRRGYKLCPMPCFMENGQAYTVRTWKLKLIRYHHDWNELPQVFFQDMADREIKRLGLTHVYIVRFCEVPITSPYGNQYHTAFVRGCTIRKNLV